MRVTISITTIIWLLIELRISMFALFRKSALLRGCWCTWLQQISVLQNITNELVRNLWDKQSSVVIHNKTSFYYVLLLIITKLCLSHKFEPICLWYFVTQIFGAVKYINNLVKAPISKTKQGLKYGDLSGVRWLLRWRLWLSFKLYGFSNLRQ